MYIGGLLLIVNAGKVINTRREVLDLLRPRGVKACFPGGFFTFFREVYSLLTGNSKASDLKGDQSFLSFVNVFCLLFSLL